MFLNIAYHEDFQDFSLAYWTDPRLLCYFIWIKSNHLNIDDGNEENGIEKQIYNFRCEFFSIFTNKNWTSLMKQPPLCVSIVHISFGGTNRARFCTEAIFQYSFYLCQIFNLFFFPSFPTKFFTQRRVFFSFKSLFSKLLFFLSEHLLDSFDIQKPRRRA